MFWERNLAYFPLCPLVFTFMSLRDWFFYICICHVEFTSAFYTSASSTSSSSMSGFTSSVSRSSLSPSFASSFIVFQSFITSSSLCTFSVSCTSSFITFLSFYNHIYPTQFFDIFNFYIWFQRAKLLHIHEKPSKSYGGRVELSPAIACHELLTTTTKTTPKTH